MKRLSQRAEILHEGTFIVYASELFQDVYEKTTVFEISELMKGFRKTY